MSQQIKQPPQSPSLIASLYAAWEYYQIPAIFYHYTLTILSQKEGKEQKAIMAREVQELKAGSHLYHIIFDTISARERSLDIINRNVHILMRSEKAVDLNWDNSEPEMQSDGYNIIYESRGVQRRDNRTLVELINHLKMYRKVTYQVIVSINSWQSSLIKYGYDKPIQFLYHHKDYLEKMVKDSSNVIENYPLLFENNPFLLLKRQLQKGQFALVYNNLKVAPEFASKIYQALQILSNHTVDIERQRLMGKYKQFGSRKKIIKSQSLHKIYCNYNNNKDYLIIKDPYLKSDKLKIHPNNRLKLLASDLLINPQMHPGTYQQKRHRVYLNVERTKKFIKKQEKLIRSSSVSNIQIRRINHKQSFVVNTKLDPTVNDEKLIQKKLSLYDSLDRAIKYQPERKVNHLNSKLKVQNISPESQPQRVNLLTPKDIIKEKQIESEVVFQYETNISPYEILAYLRDDIFKNKQIQMKDLEVIAKNIISQKDYVAIIKIKVDNLIAAWMVIRFMTKDLSIHKAIDIVFSYKFFKIPNFEDLLVEQFLRKGYGTIREKGKIVHEMQLKQKLSHQAIKIRYRISEEGNQSLIKSIIKANDCLKESRLLKYYYYSTQSKYHRYCDHTSMACQIGFDFEEAFKVCISGQPFIRLRCDKIRKVRENCFRVSHHFNNTDFMIGVELEDILQDVQPSSISNEQKEEAQKYQYLCLPQAKIMHKYLDNDEKPIVVQYLTINGDIPQILSIEFDKKNTKNCLIFQKPFCIGIVCKNEQDDGKAVALSMFK